MPWFEHSAREWALSVIYALSAHAMSYGHNSILSIVHIVYMITWVITIFLLLEQSGPVYPHPSQHLQV